MLSVLPILPTQSAGLLSHHRDEKIEQGWAISIGQDAGLALTQGDGHLPAEVTATAETYERITGHQRLTGSVSARVDRYRYARTDRSAAQLEQEIIRQGAAAIYQLGDGDIRLLIIIGDGAGLGFAD